MGWDRSVTTRVLAASGSRSPAWPSAGALMALLIVDLGGDRGRAEHTPDRRSGSGLGKRRRAGVALGAKGAGRASPGRPGSCTARRGSAARRCARRGRAARAARSRNAARAPQTSNAVWVRFERDPLAEVQRPDRLELGLVVVARDPRGRPTPRAPSGRRTDRSTSRPSVARVISEEARLGRSLTQSVGELERRAGRADVVGRERERERPRVAARPRAGLSDQPLGRRPRRR